MLNLLYAVVTFVACSLVAACVGLGAIPLWGGLACIAALFGSAVAFCTVPHE